MQCKALTAVSFWPYTRILRSEINLNMKVMQKSNMAAKMTLSELIKTFLLQIRRVKYRFLCVSVVDSESTFRY